MSHFSVDMKHCKLTMLQFFQWLKKAENNKFWQGCGVVESLCTVGRKVKWCNHQGKTVCLVLKQLELSYNPAILLLGI